MLYHFSLDNDEQERGGHINKSGHFKLNVEVIGRNRRNCFRAKNGNIVIKAHNGKIRLQGTDIELLLLVKVRKETLYAVLLNPL